MKYNAEQSIAMAKNGADPQVVAQARASAPAPAVKNTATSSQGFVLSDGQHVRPVNNGDMWVQARAGRKYRLLRAAQEDSAPQKADVAGDEAVEKVAPVDAVVALREGNHLVLLVDQEHAVTLEDYFTQCITDRCSVVVPSAKGEIPLVIEGSMWGEGWSGVIYAYGDKGVLSAISTSYGNAYAGLEKGMAAFLAVPEAVAAGGKSMGWLGMLAAGAALGAGGGGGGGGGGGDSESPVLSSTITGTFTGGPALASNKLTVQAFSSSGVSLGTTTLNSDGTYALSIAGYTGPLVVKVVRDADLLADYMDESTGVGKDLDSHVYAVGVVTAGQNVVINITPLTDIAARKMGLNEGANSVSSNSAEVDALNHLVSKLFLGLDNDVTKLDPKPVVDIHGAPVTGDAYGKVLAILSGVEFAQGSTTAQMTQLLANNLDKSTGTLSATALEVLALGISQAIQDHRVTLQEGTEMIDALRGGLTSSVPSLVIFSDTGTFNAGSGTKTVYFLLSAESSNFDASDVTVTGGTIANFVQDTTNPRLYRAEVVASSSHEGALSVSVASGAFSNAQGVVNGGAFTLSLVADTIAPTQTLGTVSLNGNAGSGGVDFYTHVAKQTITADLNAPLGSNDRLYGSVDNGVTWTDITSMVNGTHVTWTDVTLQEGAGAIVFKVRDKAGNTESVSTAVPYVLDTTAPTQTVSAVALSADTGTSTTDRITHTDAQTITATLSAALGTNDILYGSVDNGSTWTDITTMVIGTSITWSTQLLAGTNAIRFKVADKAGNPESLSTAVSYTLDTVVATPTMVLAVDSGTAGDGITNNGTVTVSGLESGATWQYSVDGGSSWSSAAPATSNTFVLPQGTYASGNVLVRQTDVAGNVSTDGSNGAAWTHDTMAAHLAITSDAGATAHGPILFTFTFDEVVTGFDINDIVVTGGTKGSFTAAAGADAGKVYTLIVTPPDGQTGNITVNVAAGTSTDVAGNATAAATPVSLPYDTVAPSIAITSDKSGLATNGDIVFTFTFSEVMTGFDLSDVNVVGGTKGIFTPAGGADAGKVYTLVVTPNALTTGEVTVSVAQGAATGSSGKDNAASAVFHQAIDTEPPAAPLGIAEQGSTDLVDGYMNTSEAVSTVFRVQLSTATDGTGPQVGDTVTLWVDGMATSRTATLTATDVGTHHYVDFTVLHADLGADGASKSLTAVITDAAGNSSGASAALTFALDTSPPAALAAPALQSDNGNNDGVTNDGTITVAGLEPGATWQYSGDGGTTWNLVSSGTSHTLSGDGAKSIIVRQVDAAGNVGDASTALNFVLDTAAPAVSNVTGGTNLAQTSGGAALSNLDVAADIVLDFGHGVSVQSGALIVLNNTGGVGFQGEAHDSDINLYLGTGANAGKTFSDAGLTVENGTYTLNAGKLTLNPTADLDLANSYEVIVSAGAVARDDTGVANATQTLSFSTVAPVLSSSGAEAVFMDGHASRYWVEWSSSGQTSDAAGKDFVFVLKDASLEEGISAPKLAIEGTTFTIQNFGAGDLIYLDSQGGKLPQADFTEDITAAQEDGPGVLSFISDGTSNTTTGKLAFVGYSKVEALDLIANHAVIAA